MHWSKYELDSEARIVSEVKAWQDTAEAYSTKEEKQNVNPCQLFWAMH